MRFLASKTTGRNHHRNGERIKKCEAIPLKKGWKGPPTGRCFGLLECERLIGTSLLSQFVTVISIYRSRHVHLNAVGEFVKQAVRDAGGVPFVFNTIGVDDGIAMGHEGMKYSLPSRELIADTVRNHGAGAIVSMG
jgi:hypothetical protein